MEIAVATWSCFRELEPGVKWILSDLLDIAAERGNCKESPEGERYLDGIPMEELCHTMIAALNVTKMKHYAAQVQTLTACSRTAAEIVKNGIRIMLSLYLEPSFGSGRHIFSSFPAIYASLSMYPSRV
mgnify:CR=1 FL=1